MQKNFFFFIFPLIMLSFLYKMQRLNLTPIAIDFVKVKPVNPLTIFQTYCLSAKRSKRSKE